jgi:hypothetical protein
MEPEQAERRYLRAVHYFADAGIANFWTAFDREAVPADFERIRNDGFDTIILVVPWASFQPTIDPPRTSFVHLERLRWLIRQATENGLKVALRLGYLWERDSVAIPTLDRYRTVLRTATADGAAMEAAWTAYHRAVAENAQGIEFAFLSWEDSYWPILRGPPSRDLEIRETVAVSSGFSTHSGLSAVPVPDEPGYRAWLRFYDQVVLNRLVALAAPAWEGVDLRFEHRLDGDRWVDDEGNGHWYQQSLIRPGARGDLVYYHPDLRTSGQGTRERAAALLHLEETFRQYQLLGAERPFVDQFNFELNNPEFPDFSSTHEDHLPELIAAAAPLFARYTSGYGLWGWRDWIDDQISNGRFALGAYDWELEGCPRSDGLLAVHRGSTLVQRRPRVKMARALVELTVAEVSEPLTLAVSLAAEGGEQGGEMTIASPGVSTLEFEALKAPTLRIEVRDGRGRIARVALYSHVFTNGCYARDWTERPAIRAIRGLNAELSAAQG